MHIRNVYADGELTPEATVKDFLTVRREGSRDVQRRLEFYNLDMIISVGYRVKSAVATRFRQWATERLREYIVKGFTLDDERLKGRDRLADYFDELLARILEIRASEKRLYQRIREIFALATDYHIFRGDRWLGLHKNDRRNYLRNAYRVLLTRARQGMVIFVPPGESTDPTRSPAFYDSTFRYLSNLGIPVLDR
jgi:hypothetical protein